MTYLKCTQCGAMTKAPQDDAEQLARVVRAGGHLACPCGAAFVLHVGLYLVEVLPPGEARRVASELDVRRVHQSVRERCTRVLREKPGLSAEALGDAVAAELDALDTAERVQVLHASSMDGDLAYANKGAPAGTYRPEDITDMILPMLVGILYCVAKELCEKRQAPPAAPVAPAAPLSAPLAFDFKRYPHLAHAYRAAKETPCPDCGGKGEVLLPAECRMCGGNGLASISAREDYCRECGGNGEAYYAEPCSTCASGRAAAEPAAPAAQKVPERPPSPSPDCGYCGGSGRLRYVAECLDCAGRGLTGEGSPCGACVGVGRLQVVSVCGLCAVVSAEAAFPANPPPEAVAPPKLDRCPRCAKSELPGHLTCRECGGGGLMVCPNCEGLG